jgi:hypothetical protein
MNLTISEAFTLGVLFGILFNHIMATVMGRRKVKDICNKILAETKKKG